MYIKARLPVNLLLSNVLNVQVAPRSLKAHTRLLIFKKKIGVFRRLEGWLSSTAVMPRMSLSLILPVPFIGAQIWHNVRSANHHCYRVTTVIDMLPVLTPKCQLERALGSVLRISNPP